MTSCVRSSDEEAAMIRAWISRRALLLALALTKTRDANEIQRMFDTY